MAIPPTMAIEAEGLTKVFGDTRALDGLDLHVPTGTVLGMLGPNGAGKTTAVRVLTTLSPPTAGRARVAGYDVVDAAGEVRKHIGLTGQYASVDESLTGTQNLVMIGQLCRLSRRRAQQQAAALFERFTLSDAANRPVKTYSGGMRRRLDLAASLIGEPEILFLDEPTTGLDPNARLLMWDVIRGLVDGGTTLLLTTQYLEEADQLADRIVVIDEGRVIAEGTSDELKRMVGGELLDVTVTAGGRLPDAQHVLADYAVGPIHVDPDARLLSVPARDTEPGLVTAVVGALADAGIRVDALTVRRPSLDDVFLELTGHTATANTDDDEEVAA
jgi:daunorubicin resistance ABC transporter ATP-binding subunit